METLYITHPACRLHEMGSWHPESPQRLDAIGDQLLASGLMGHLTHYDATEATEADILRVHSRQHLDHLRQVAPASGYFGIDGDTMMNPHTLPAAWASAGAGLTAVDAIMQGKARTAFCAVRPPGHHARPDQAMGFCFFNNVAVAAAYALQVHGLQRVAIIDFDVHHGNGTEEMFADDPRILMCSFYQEALFPQLPRTYADNMVNVPVPANTSGEELRQVVYDCWLPRLRTFAPEMIFISAGFDAHREDDMGQLGMTESDYSWITQQILDQAELSAQGRVVSLLEGGYCLSPLARSVVAHVKVLAKL